MVRSRPEIGASEDRGEPLAFLEVLEHLRCPVDLHPLRWWSLIVSALVALVTVAAPSLLTVPNRLWLRFGLLLHRIVSPVVLGIMFYLVVMPMGLLMRALGKDFLRLRRNDSAESYWIKRDPPGPEPASMSNQF